MSGIGIRKTAVQRAHRALVEAEFIANTIKLGLKIYQEDGLGVSTKIFDLPAPEGYKRGEKCTIKVEDAITSVSISVNGTALAVVELSEPGTEYKTDDPVYGFYKKAVVKNAAGE